MFSVMKFPRPTRSVLQWDRGKRTSRICSVARTVSSRRRISGRATEPFNGHESFSGAQQLWCFKFARASYLVSGEPWSTVRKEQKAFGRFSVSSAAIGVCAGLMSASVRVRQKKDSRAWFVKRVVSWLRRWVVSRNGQGSGEVPGPFVARSGCFFRNVQVRTRMRCLLPDRRFARTSRKCRCNIWNPRNGNWAANGGFFREDNIIVLEGTSHPAYCRICRELLSAWTPPDPF